ncbi:MAG: DUF4493 domain-containing protein [Parabacteroides gordonii]|nr:DUF4493 domain-containing protein [Parabacteroides gordonii]
MKYYIKVWYSLCLLIGLLVSCNDDRNQVPVGTLYLNVEEDKTLFTRSTSEVTYESLQVAILKGEEDTLKVYHDYLAEVKGERLVLPVGTYTVAVSSNHDGAAAWEAPFYAGQETVEVKQGEITNAKVTCTIHNTKVSVDASQLKDYFADYQTEVSNSSGSLVYTRDEYRAGYFAPEKFTVKLKLVNRDGNEFVIKRVYPNIEPTYHYTFKFEIDNQGSGDTDAGIDFDITIDEEHKEITCPIFICEEDLTQMGEPSLRLQGFTAESIFQYPEIVDGMEPPVAGTVGLAYRIGKKNSIQSFKVTTNSPTFATAGLSEFEMTDKAVAEQVARLGFPRLPDTPAKEEELYMNYELDLSAMLPYLKTIDRKPTVHAFTVTLLDNINQETSIEFSFKIMPDVDAYVEEPVKWTNFVVLKGVCLDESSYFMLQVADGEPKKVDVVQRDTEGNLSALVIGLKPGAEYTYWIESADNPAMKCEPIGFNLTKPLEVPNLLFDNWGTRSGSGAIGGNVTYPCLDGTNSSGGVYWESGNRGAASGGETLLQGESSDVKKGKAAKLTSRWAGALGIGAFSAGSIFSGFVQEVSTAGAKLKYGQLHNGYPTALQGWYKYHPGKINWVDNKETSTNDTDEAIIYIALTTKQYTLESLRTNINGVVTFDPADKGVIAYGEMKTQQEVAEYEQFNIPLVYSRLPKTDEKVYIIIMASSSSKGEFFKGSTDSWMLLDEFELIYDYNDSAIPASAVGNMMPIDINK